MNHILNLMIEDFLKIIKNLLSFEDNILSLKEKKNENNDLKFNNDSNNKNKLEKNINEEFLINKIIIEINKDYDNINEKFHEILKKL